MDNFKNLQDAWKNQDLTELPEGKIIKQNIMKLEKDIDRKYLSGIISLALTCVVMVVLLITIDFDHISSQIALVLITITMGGGAFYLNQLRKNISKSDQLQHSTKEYLAHLRAFKVKQETMQQRDLSWYFVIMTLSMLLYFYGLYHTNAMVGIVGFSLSVLWMLFVWFYLRPLQIKRYGERINKLIAEVERIERQLK